MKKILIVILLGCIAVTAAEPVVWKNKNSGKTRENNGLYIWWAQGLVRTPGTYRITARIKRDNPGNFTLQAVDAISGKVHWQKAATVSGEFSDIDFGEFNYDGSYSLRISDWNEPGFYLESVTMTPVKLEELPQEKQVSADTLKGWCALYRTEIGIDEKVKKEGTGSLKVTVNPKEGEHWYDVGVIRRMPAGEAKMLSFWLRFEDEPRRIWVNMITATGSSVTTVDPVQFEVKKGEWKLIEVHAASFHFRPVRQVLNNILAISFSPEPKGGKCTFFLDDILFE